MKIHECFLVNGLEIRAEFDSRDKDEIYLPLLFHLAQLQRAKGRRILVFLAAPPAAGKSTLCLYLEKLSRTVKGLTPVQAVGIDGFHYTNAELRRRSILKNGRELPLSAVKGAPETYDVAALSACIARIQEEDLRFPAYDRRIHDPVPNAIQIREKIVILEGNWLLLNEEPWSKLTCDYSIFIRAGDEGQLERIVRRKMMGGFGEAEAREMVQRNDWPNIQRCMANSRRGDKNFAFAPDGRLEEI